MGSDKHPSPVGTSTRVQRNRKPVSCDPCRHKKYGPLTIWPTCLADSHRLKCDRALPACSSCLARSDISSCTYQHRRPGTQRHWPLSHTSSTSTHARIDQLESLLRKAIEKCSSQNVASVLDPLSQSCDTTPTNVLAYGSGNPIMTIQLDEHLNLDDVLRIQDDSKQSSSTDGGHWDALLGRVRWFHAQ